jgi:hypothetical protein
MREGQLRTDSVVVSHSIGGNTAGTIWMDIVGRSWQDHAGAEKPSSLPISASHDIVSGLEEYHIAGLSVVSSRFW